MNPTALIAHANQLAKATRSKPRQVDLKRAVSAAYYAMFHSLARECANTITGPDRAARNSIAWVQVYRALEHGMTRNACRQASTRGFSLGILTFATTFATMQEKRHLADYDPLSTFARVDVVALIADAEQAIAGLRRATRPDRRAFVALVLLREPRR